MFVVVERFSKMSHLYCVGSHNFSNIAKLHFREIAKLHGVPKVLLPTRTSSSLVIFEGFCGRCFVPICTLVMPIIHKQIGRLKL